MRLQNTSFANRPITSRKGTLYKCDGTGTVMVTDLDDVKDFTALGFGCLVAGVVSIPLSTFIAGTTSIAIAHGLGRAPVCAWGAFVCRIADGPAAVGMSFPGTNYYYDAVNIYINRYAGAEQGWWTPQDSSQTFNLDPTKWDYTVNLL